MGSRRTRISLVALTFVSASLYHQVRHLGETLVRSLPPQDAAARDVPRRRRSDAAREAPPPSRLDYVRPPGRTDELLDVLERLSSPHLRQLPRTPRDIAARYGVPRTSRDVRCDANGTTTVGWIPRAAAASDASPREDDDASSAISRQGKIPRLIFQSWKTNELEGRMCRHVLRWSAMNPEYDYFLFSDASLDGENTLIGGTSN